MKLRTSFVLCLIFINCSYIFAFSENEQFDRKKKDLEKGFCLGNCETLCDACYAAETLNAARTWSTEKWEQEKSKLANSKLCSFGNRCSLNYTQKREMMFEELIQEELERLTQDELSPQHRKAHLISTKRLIIEQNDIIYPWRRSKFESWVSLKSALGGILTGGIMVLTFRSKKEDKDK